MRTEHKPASPKIKRHSRMHPHHITSIDPSWQDHWDGWQSPHIRTPGWWHPNTRSSPPASSVGGRLRCSSPCKSESTSCSSSGLLGGRLRTLHLCGGRKPRRDQRRSGRGTIAQTDLLPSAHTCHPKYQLSNRATACTSRCCPPKCQRPRAKKSPDSRNSHTLRFCSSQNKCHSWARGTPSKNSQ